MPFLQAGFNGHHYSTGIRAWTRHVDGKSKFAPAKLIRFEGGDYAWHGQRFLAWGECVVLGSWGFVLAWEYQNYLPMCDLATREELVVWEWVEKRRTALEKGEELQ